MPRPEPVYTLEALQAECSAKFEVSSFTRDDAVALGMATSAVIAGESSRSVKAGSHLTRRAAAAAAAPRVGTHPSLSMPSQSPTG